MTIVCKVDDNPQHEWPDSMQRALLSSYNPRHLPVVYDTLPDKEWLVLYYELEMLAQELGRRELKLRDLEQATIN